MTKIGKGMGKGRTTLKLGQAEAAEAWAKLKPFVAFSRKSGMSGIGWGRGCPICASKTEEEIDAINVALMAGGVPRRVSEQFMGAANDTTRRAMERHRKHVVAAFWAQGMGGRIAADGFYLDYPQEGRGRDRMTWYLRKFQWLAHQAEQSADYREMRNCLKEAAACDKAIIVLDEHDEDPRKMKRALEIPADHEKRLVEEIGRAHV